MKNHLLMPWLVPVFLLSGCFGDKDKEKKVVLGESKQKSSFVNEYNAEGEWLILPADGRRGVQHYIVSKGNGSQRLVEIYPKGGYIVHKIDVSCERKGISDLGSGMAKVAKMDIMPPIMPAPKTATIPDIQRDIDIICGKGEKEIIKGLLGVAVRSARSKELDFQKIRETIRPSMAPSSNSERTEKRTKMSDGSIVITTTVDKPK